MLPGGQSRVRTNSAKSVNRCATHSSNFESVTPMALNYLAETSPVRVLFLVTANNGLTQRATLKLREEGHSVRVAVADSAESMRAAVAPADFDLIICPYLKAYIPDEIWRDHLVIVVHPGPPGDRGPSSLDWAITMGEPAWGVIAFAATAEMDAGPVWAWRSFDIMPGTRKSALYNGAVADAAVDCISEVVANFRDPQFTPLPANKVDRPVASAQERPVMKQADRAFSWEDDASTIVRKVLAGDGAPGVLAELAGEKFYVYDASAAGPVSAPPGTIVEHAYGAVRVATRNDSIWIGHLRKPGKGNFKLPAAQLLAAAAPAAGDGTPGQPEIRYHRYGDIGEVSFNFYNGAMSTEQCGRLRQALARAMERDTRVLIVSGGPEFFSNGIHLNIIEAAENPAREAWANISAINEICHQIVGCTNQVVIAAFTGNAGAGGVMLPLGADEVVAREDIVLNPHYATMGLYGSELHTYTLPRRVGPEIATRLLTDCEPISARQAAKIGLVDSVGPRELDKFDAWVRDIAARYAEAPLWEATIAAKQARLKTDAMRMPLSAYETLELAEMAQDMFHDRNGFAAKRHNFVLKL